MKKADKSHRDSVMSTLQLCAEQLLIAKIVYQKPGQEWVTERLVEAYSASSTAANLIVQCWQLNPDLDEPAWRSFRLDRIISAAPTPTSFKARCQVTLHTGEVSKYEFEDRPHGQNTDKQPPQQIYSEALHLKLDAAKTSDADILELQEIASALSIAQVRAIHGRYYAESLTGGVR